MASVVGLEVKDKSSTRINVTQLNFFDNALTHFSTIMAIVVGLMVVN